MGRLVLAQLSRRCCHWKPGTSRSCLRLASTHVSPHSLTASLGSKINQSPIGDHVSSSRLKGAATASTFPNGELEEIPIPERMRLIAWLAYHNAIDLSFFRARAKASEPLGPNDERPVDYSWIELTLRLSDWNATRLRDVLRQASQPDALRSGRLLEVLDCFAGDIAFSYCRPSIALNEDKADLFVTVAIDSIRLFDQEHCLQSVGSAETCQYISVTKDLILRGFVSHAGNSSVEITAELHQDGRFVGSAFLVFVHVGRDGSPKKSMPPLSKICDNPEIARQLHEAEERQYARKELANKDVSFRGPDQEESEFLHNAWIATKGTALNIKWIRDTRLDSNILMQPETISMYGRAFGGYIMRSALELSILTAQRFLAQKSPVITGMEDIRFFDAVKLGDILHLCSHVVWSDRDEVQIQVVASSSSVGSPLKRTNRFVFYYKQDPNCQKLDPSEIQVYPQSYEEYMSLLEARRRAIKRSRLRGAGSSS